MEIIYIYIFFLFFIVILAIELESKMEELIKEVLHDVFF